MDSARRGENEQQAAEEDDAPAPPIAKADNLGDGIDSKTVAVMPGNTGQDGVSVSKNRTS